MRLRILAESHAITADFESSLIYGRADTGYKVELICMKSDFVVMMLRERFW